MYTNPLLNNLSRNLFYTLKRNFGGPISIYKNLGSSVDPKTGIVTVSKDVTPIYRAIILPSKVARQLVKSTPEKIANRAFDMGAFYDTSARLFIVDRRDTPNLDLTEDDWIVYNGSKFQVTSFQGYEFGTAWLITATELRGEGFSQIFPLAATSYLEASSEVT